MKAARLFCLIYALALAGRPSMAADSEVNGEIKSFRIASPFQAESTSVRVLLPEGLTSAQQYRVLYVLPVVKKDNRRFGDALAEIEKNGFHNKYRLICVAPEFTSLPWYANHESNMKQQDESHFIKTVIPFVDGNFPTINNERGRLLLGFSKSGWGAFSLLLRHPDLFYKAAGWDIGIRIDTGPISQKERAERIERIFGSTANFERYRISTLLKKQAGLLQGKARLFYYNTESKRALGGAEIHRLMVQLGIPHRYLFEPKRRHRWDSGWIPEAVRFLVDDVTDQQERKDEK